jgi:N-acetylmuramoyl-L-alanine amidase
MFGRRKLITAIVILVHHWSAFAYELEDQPGYINPTRPIQSSVVKPIHEATLFNDPERIRKFNRVLTSLNIPLESRPDFSFYPNTPVTTRADLEAIQNFLDPDAGLRRYLSVSDQGFSLFRDFVSAVLPAGFLEYSTHFIQNGASRDTEDLLWKLNQISAQARDPNSLRPLAGLKILIDPGHMGTPDWDENTGKYVEINGKRVSEGQLNLWTALLSANAFESLGATVLLTRTVDGAVSTANPATFDITPYFNLYFYSSLDSWMAPYLAYPENEMLLRVKAAPETIKAYSSTQRGQFFITGADLEARSNLIDSWKPDVVIDIHYDANQNNQLQARDNTIEAFVPGAFRANETGSRYVRSLMTNHLLETRRWNTSVALAGSMIEGMSQSLGLQRQNVENFITSVKVKDGIYARNLYINRRNTSSLMVYLECLHYDHVNEFNGLTQLDQTGNYHGLTFHYPSRLNDVALGIKNGFLRYFQNQN